VYASEHFASPNIPIPRTIYLNKLDETHYISVTERVEGKILDAYSTADMEKIVPNIVETLDAIHATPINHTEGFGNWDNGKGENQSWRDYLVERVNEIRRYNSKPNKPSFYDPHFSEQLLARYEALIPYCPNIRKLVHGDFGFNNALSDGKKITGVIDWEQSLFGDPLFDVGWLSLWSGTIPYKDIFREHYKNSPKYAEHFDERVDCYVLYGALGSLKFFSESGQEEAYRRSKEKLQKRFLT
jgi:hygromycin-B 4-O-kinase